MKKTLLIIILGAFGAMAIATPALATTSVSFTPVNVSVRQGQIFTLTIVVNPQGVKNYTVKTELRYPADFLELKSFNFANGWIPLSQSGYDLVDNINGILIKTAGYPGGLSSSATFGTVSFYAKKTGNGTITLGGGSLALDANNQNVISGASSVSVAVTAPVSVPAEKPTVAPSPAETLTTPEQPTTEQLIEQPEEQPVAQTAAQTSLVATIGGFMTFGTGNIWLGILVGLIILVVVVYLVYVFLQRRKRS